MDISSLRERASLDAMTVTELNNYIKNVFDKDRTLGSLTVKGELSNFKFHGSGHLYFSLKDGDSQLRCVMFRSSAQRLKFIPENGMKLIAHGSVSVYTRDGSYQLYVGSLQPDGVGALYLAYEQLKAKLENEGLFSDSTKKDIPSLPRAIGVITSATGAAVRDIINVMGRRCPLTKIYLYPSLVQGDGAPENLIKALEYFNNSELVDTVIIGRGGGSIEDLWAFNNEALARKIFSMSIPVISAVGHETDFTICDFVSDMRAPTPSAAAELAVPDIRELYMLLTDAEARLQNSLLRSVERVGERLASNTDKLLLLSKSFFSSKRSDLNVCADRLAKAAKAAIGNKRNIMQIAVEKLNAMNPLSVLSRGFTITEKNRELVKSINSLRDGDTVSILFKDGKADATVTHAERN